MFLQLSAVDSFKVARERFGLHWVHDWVAFLDSLGTVSCHETEVLEILAIRRREFEVSGNVAAKSVNGEKKVKKRRSRREALT